MQNLNNLFLLLMVLLLVGCQENITDAERAEAHVITQNGYNCGNYQYVDFREDDANVEQLLVANDIVYYVTFNREIKAYARRTGETFTLANDVQINAMERQGGKVYFCTRNGIFSVRTNDINSYTQESIYSCEYMAVTAEETILFIGWNLEPDRYTYIQRIYKVLGPDSVEAVTESAGSQLSSFNVLDNGTILAFNSGNTDEMYRFTSEGVLENTFTTDNSPLGTRNFENHILTEVAGNKLYVVLKNGLGFARIIEWDESSLSWRSYLEESNFESVRETERWKIVDVIAPSYTDIAIQDTDLYISTSFAGCRGLIRMRLTNGEPLILEDIDIIRDTGFDVGHCLQGLQFDEANNRKYIYSQRGLMILENCQ